MHLFCLQLSLWNAQVIMCYTITCNCCCLELNPFFISCRIFFRVVTKISSCRVFVDSSRRSRKQSSSATSTVFQKALPLPKSNLHQEYSYHTAIMMITSLLKKTTTFWDTKIISFYCKWINMRCKINCKSSFSYT